MGILFLIPANDLPGKFVFEMDVAKMIIAGGGIGGLTTALCLHKAGLDVHLYESAREIKPLGVGINLLPHAVRVLTNLGLQNELRKVAIATSELAYYSKHGKKNMAGTERKICRIQLASVLDPSRRFSNVIVAASKRSLGKDKVHTGYVLQHAINKKNFVEVSFINKETNETITIESDALIAADGIHSTMRKQFYPAEGPPKFAGIILHRGITKAKHTDHRRKVIISVFKIL